MQGSDMRPAVERARGWVLRFSRHPTWPYVLAFALTTFVFMPKALLGIGLFAPADILSLGSPYHDQMASTPEVLSVIQNDGIQGLAVQLAAADALRHGDWLLWTPWASGGATVAGLPFSGVQSPFYLGLVLFPTWGLALAIAARLFVSQLFFFLLLRRFNVSPVVSAFGAIAYTFCGTNLVLLGRIGAYLLLPALLWACVRILEDRRPIHVAALALIGALTWLEGFAGGYVNAMAIAGALTLPLAPMLARRDTARAGLTKRVAVGVAAVAVGMGLSAGLAAFSALPFQATATQSGLAARAYSNEARLPAVTAPAILSVGALGNPYRSTVFNRRYPGGLISGAGNSVELGSAAGFPVAAIAFFGILATLFGWIRLTRRQRALLVVALITLVAGVTLVYFDTPLLSLFYSLPVIGNSPVGRFRIVTNIAIVLLACLALEGWLRRVNATGDAPHQAAAPAETEARPPGWSLRAIVLVSLIALVGLFRTVAPEYWGWLKSVEGGFVRPELALELALSIVAVVGAISLIYVIRRKWPRRAQPVQVAAVAGLTLLAFAALAYPLRNFSPTVDRDLLFPQTEGHRELDRLTQQRYRIVGSGLGTYYSNSSVRYEFLDLRGLSLQNRAFQRLVKAGLPRAFALDQTKVIFDPAGDPINVGAPALDDLGIRYIVTGSGESPYAIRSKRTGRAFRRVPLTSVTPSAVVRGRGALAGVQVPLGRLTPCEGGRITVIASRGGQVLDRSSRPAVDVPLGSSGPAAFMLATPSLRPGLPVRVAARVTGKGCRVAIGVTRQGLPAVTRLAAKRSVPLRATATEQGVFYRRRGAHPIVRLTARWRATRSDREASDLGVSPMRKQSDPVPVFGAGQPPARPTRVGRAGPVTYNANGFTLDVSTPGRRLLASGFAGDRKAWKVTIDGKPARLALIDGALLGVAVDEGRHRVRFTYTPSGLKAGAAISGMSLVAILGLVVLDRRRRRHRGRMA